MPSIDPAIRHAARGKPRVGAPAQPSNIDPPAKWMRGPAIIAELEGDIHDVAGDDARGGFDRVAMMLAAMDDDEG